MKKHLTMLLALLLVVAVAAPALAAVEFKYGGQFRTRWVVENNKYDGTDGRDQLYRDELGWYLAPDGKNYDDNRNLIDTRLRLYFSFIASQNLKVVTKLEMGDSYWGDPSPIGTTGNSKYSTGGRVGADAVNVELKNAYVEFNIPMTPSTAIVGIQTLSLLDSWIIDDDFSAAVIKTKLDPVSVTVGYVSGQNGPVAFTGDLAFTDYSRRIDDFFLSIDYKHGPFKASLIGFYQYGHDTNVSFDPNTLFTPAGVVGSRSSSFLSRTPWLVGDEILYSGFEVQDNNLFDLGFNVSYKIDYLSAYVNFVKNLGSVDLHNPFTGAKVASADYTGWMVDAGVSYYCGPYTLNLGGFYTTGPDLTDRPADFEYASAFSLKDSDITWFTYPWRPPSTSLKSSVAVSLAMTGMRTAVTPVEPARARARPTTSTGEATASPRTCGPLPPAPHGRLLKRPRSVLLTGTLERLKVCPPSSTRYSTVMVTLSAATSACPTASVTNSTCTSIRASWTA